MTNSTKNRFWSKLQVGAFQMYLAQKVLKHSALFLGRIVEHTWRTWISEPLDQCHQKQVLVKATSWGIPNMLGSKKSGTVDSFSRGG